MAEKTGQLTPKQRRAIDALLQYPTQKLAAAAAGVGERTLTRWVNDDPAFQAALRQAEGRVIDAATRQLLVLQGKAAETIVEVMTAKDAPASVRLRAAQLIIDFLLRLRELRNVESRLAALEEAIGNEQG